MSWVRQKEEGKTAKEKGKGKEKMAIIGLGTWQRQKSQPKSQLGLKWVLLHIWQVLEKKIVLGLPASSLEIYIFSQVTKKCIFHAKETWPSPVVPLPRIAVPEFLGLCPPAHPELCRVPGPSSFCLQRSNKFSCK